MTDWKVTEAMSQSDWEVGKDMVSQTFPINYLSVTLIFSDCVFISWSEVAQLCPTLCDPMDYSPPGSSIHGIFQASVLEWVAISFSRGSSWPRDRTGSPALQADALPSELPGEPIFVTYTDEILTLQWCKGKPCVFLFLLLLWYSWFTILY